jgi:alpha-beta hydrolase superfamily lysophospholipase
MGAVTAMNYLAKRKKYVQSVKVAVLDSPFLNLKEVIYEIVNKKVKAPKVLIDFFLSYL